MKRFIKLLLFTFLTTTFFGCPQPDGDEIQAVIKVKNASEINLYTLAKGKNPELYNWAPNSNYFIPIGEVYEYGGNFYSSLSGGTKQYIWLFDEEVINNNSWEDIVAKDMYLIRYDLTLQDLEDMNWVIDYTGE